MKSCPPNRLSRWRLGLVGCAALVSASSTSGQIAPYTHSQPVTMKEATTAVLNGMAMANGSVAKAWFEWGTNASLGWTTKTNSIGNAYSVTRVSLAVSNLLPGALYYYRLAATNAAGVSYSPIRPFTTGSKVSAWGDNSQGACEPPPGLTNLVAVAGGGLNFSLALDATGNVSAWGYPGSRLNMPADLTNIVSIAAGYQHSLALRSDGTPVAWGEELEIAGISIFRSVIALAGGGRHALVLFASGGVSGTGDNTYHQLNPPYQANNLVQVAAGYFHSLGLRADGTVVAWGDNSTGQLNVPRGLTNVASIAAGFWHSLALRADGTVVAWGSYNGTNVPPGLSQVIAISAGRGHGLALKSDLTVVGWGDGLTNTNWPDVGQALPPAGLSNVVSLSCGGTHSLAAGANVAPQARDAVVNLFPNTQAVMVPPAADVNGDALQRQVLSLPQDGALYQYDNGSPGAAITAPGTLISDSLGRLIFSPRTNAAAAPYASFAFSAADGTAQSAPATVTLNVLLPASPRFDAAGSSVGPDGQFALHFTGSSKALYRVWASTNLLDWQLLGNSVPDLNGAFTFLDAEAAHFPQRFYRASAP